MAGLTLLYAACVALGRSLYRTWWGVAALATALTLRHRIPDTAVNSIEAYLHPRQLAFAVGLLAMGLFLRGRRAGAAGAVAGACLFHPTTALWFVILLGVAGLLTDPASRRPILLAAAALLPAAVVLLLGGFREQLDVMSPSWTALLESKDYLQATQWPMLTWFANLGLAAVIAAVYDYRRSLGMTRDRETGLVAGCLVLLVLFLVSVPLASIGVAIVVQLQFSRIFWLLDFVAIAYAAWLVVESPAGLRRPRVRRAAIALIVLASLARGSYVTLVERADHAFVEIDLPASEWTDVMKWAGERPVGTNFLTDPGHAWRYGSSVRAASGRDVYLESVKDIASPSTPVPWPHASAAASPSSGTSRNSSRPTHDGSPNATTSTISSRSTPSTCRWCIGTVGSRCTLCATMPSWRGAIRRPTGSDDLPARSGARRVRPA